MKFITRWLALFAIVVTITYQCISYIAVTPMFAQIRKSPNKCSSLWQKKTKLALLITDYSETDDYTRLYNDMISWWRADIAAHPIVVDQAEPRTASNDIATMPIIGG